MRFATAALGAAAAAALLASPSAALGPLSKVSQSSVAAVDRDALAEEDAAAEAAGAAPRFAVPIEEDVSAARGAWEEGPGGAQVFRHLVRTENGSSLNFKFEFRMPRGGKLTFHDANMRQLPGSPTFTAADNKPHGELWTPVLPVRELVIQVTLPADADTEDAGVVLRQTNVGYRGFHAPGGPGPKSGSCNVDVVCGAGDEEDPGDAANYARIDDWRAEIPSVAVYSTGGSRFCSGAMINNVKEDRTPYFLTANHCGIGPGNAPSLVAYFSYETSTCGADPDGQLTYFLTGAQHLISNPESDMTLVRMNDPVPDEWIRDRIASFAGWDRSGDDATMAVAIHHPSTDEKRISFENDPTSTTGWLESPGPNAGITHVRVEDWDLGTTEPGSSGSPLFNQDRRVIGQLHGGSAACGNDLPDWYGKFSVSWAAGLAQWLDPDGTGDTTTDTLSRPESPTTSPRPTDAPTTPVPTGAPTPCPAENIRATVTVLTDNYPQETAWTIARVNGCDGDGTDVQAQGGPYPVEATATTYVEELCLPPTKYRFEITDSFGDGICCGFGEGSWSLAAEGRMFEGGEFGFSDTADFGRCGPPEPTVSPRPTQAPTTPPTTAPTQSPTPCPAENIRATVAILTDDYPEETTWVIRRRGCDGDGDGPGVVARGGPFPDTRTEYVEELCLPPTKYRFKITDSFGDGICCAFGEGSWSVTAGDVSFEGGAFGSSEVADFGDCPTPSPTSAPTSAPTSSPTSAPTSSPTSAPTSTPTALDCTNVPGWKHTTSNGREKPCRWVGRKRTAKRCLLNGATRNGVVMPAYEACKEQCIAACQTDPQFT